MSPRSVLRKKSGGLRYWQLWERTLGCVLLGAWLSAIQQDRETILEADAGRDQSPLLEPPKRITGAQVEYAEVWSGVIKSEIFSAGGLPHCYAPRSDMGVLDCRVGYASLQWTG